MQLDLTPILQAVVGLATIALTTLGGWAITKLAQKLGVEKNTALMANLTTAATSGISFAVMGAQREIAAKGWDHPEVQSQLVGAAAQFVASKFGDTLASAGLDPATATGQQAIHDLVLRALPAGTAAAAASPTTPPAPAPAVVAVVPATMEGVKP